MPVHENSKESFQDHLNSGAELTQREKITFFITEAGKHTDRQIAGAIGVDLSDVRSAITRLIEDKLLEEADSIKCATTGRKVRLVDLPKEQQQFNF